jgi:hypothetical protein
MIFVLSLFLIASLQKYRQKTSPLHLTGRLRINGYWLIVNFSFFHFQLLLYFRLLDTLALLEAAL